MSDENRKSNLSDAELAALAQRNPDYFTEEQRKKIRRDDFLDQPYKDRVDNRTPEQKKKDYLDALARQEGQFIKKSPHEFSSKNAHSSFRTAWLAYAQEGFKQFLDPPTKQIMLDRIDRALNSLKKIAKDHSKIVRLSSMEALDAANKAVGNDVYGSMLRKAFLKIRVGRKVRADGKILGDPVRRLNVSNDGGAPQPKSA